MAALSWRVRAVRLPDGEAIDAGLTPAGRWTPRPQPDAELLPGRFVLPGLVDAHCHLSIGVGSGGPAGLGVDAARAAAAQARAEGVTGIRDVGSPGSVTPKLLPEDGGDLVACSRFLAPEDRYFRSLYSPVSAAELVPAALAEIAAGARWVKLIGDSPPRDGTGRPAHDARCGPDRTASADPADAVPTYQVADVRRLADAVYAAGARVAVHHVPVRTGTDRRRGRLGRARLRARRGRPGGARRSRWGLDAPPYAWRWDSAEVPIRSSAGPGMSAGSGWPGCCR